MKKDKKKQSIKSALKNLKYDDFRKLNEAWEKSNVKV